MKEFKFTMSESEANLMFAALAKLPFEAVYQLVGKLQAQAQQQSQPAAPIESPSNQ